MFSALAPRLTLPCICASFILSLVPGDEETITRSGHLLYKGCVTRGVWKAIPGNAGFDQNTVQDSGNDNGI